MTLGTTGAVGGAVGIASAAWWRNKHREFRDRRYAQLSSREQDVARQYPVVLSKTVPDPEALAKTFAAERVVRVGDFLEQACLAEMRTEGLATRSAMERSFIPLHKQGSTLSYEKIMQLAPRCWSFYRSPVVSRWLERLTGVPMLPTPVQDQSSLSLLCYQHEGDHIQWHYDHNFYRGRHFTVLLALVNQSADGGVSRSVFQRQLPGGGAQEFETTTNSLIVFEGAKVRHRATPAAAGDLRLLLSMTYCADPRISRVKEAARRIKDTAFFGVRALWD
jgi:hypothetical protein